MDILVFGIFVGLSMWIFDLKQKLSEEKIRNINLKFKNEELKKDVERLTTKKQGE